ncbi:MAG TPA: sulfurtransferase TusA family protein [Smithellaceae bacterium]|jgi:tRNA 2-thiouridine synthesizing protein A|nr:sulfurtransferase TusA family protein [Syntrophaceae bacterium]MDX9816108.1 sulfurtransferase TusA family protein [Smithellaceae bacterium]NMD05093.1 SirA family protein [Deltaproteobacteria bacterium]OPZ51292.1 MAG: SirA-like protein [Deltaproteobacteria bacterium ADurb.BinA014]MBP8608120.1 sulfurtransferase TusA family protein [Syntrophaceae bacterium]
MVEVDVKGLSCPIPVVKTKQAMENNPKDTITVILDSNVSRENISRLAESKKYSVKVEQISGEESKLILTPPA